jgi:hypothetical protein
MPNETQDAGLPRYVPFALTKDVVTEMFPVETEPKIPTMDKPLIIESACPGWQMGEKRFPAVPTAIKDQIREQVDSLKAGAIIAHIHPRDPKTGLAQMNHELLTEILDGVFTEFGDCVTFTDSLYPVLNAEVDCIIGTERLLELGQGNKYVQGSLMVPIGHRRRGQPSYFSVRGAVEGVKWLEAHGVKPVYQLSIRTPTSFKRHIFDKNIDGIRPRIMNIQLENTTPMCRTGIRGPICN